MRPAACSAALSKAGGTGTRPGGASQSAPDSGNHLGDGQRRRIGSDERLPQPPGCSEHGVDRRDQIVERKQRAAAAQCAKRQRIGRTREPQQLRHVALHAGSVDQDEP